MDGREGERNDDNETGRRVGKADRKEMSVVQLDDILKLSALPTLATRLVMLCVFGGKLKIP